MARYPDVHVHIAEEYPGGYTTMKATISTARRIPTPATYWSWCRAPSGRAGPATGRRRAHSGSDLPLLQPPAVHDDDAGVLALGSPRLRAGRRMASGVAIFLNPDRIDPPARAYRAPHSCRANSRENARNTPLVHGLFTFREKSCATTGDVNPSRPPGTRQ